jgi:hypothetical protein
MEFCSAIGASRGTQPASDTAFPVHGSHAILLKDCIHLASFQTDFATLAFIRIDNSEIAG